MTAMTGDVGIHGGVEMIGMTIMMTTGDVETYLDVKISWDVEIPGDVGAMTMTTITGADAAPGGRKDGVVTGDEAMIRTMTINPYPAAKNIVC